MDTKIDNTGYSFSERENIREIYKKVEPGKPMTPYLFDLKLSNIEHLTWNLLRGFPYTRNFKPEYPIGRYFVDFGDPVHKVAIECDSKEFHKDKTKDKKRQDEIISMGWKVIRFPSSAILSMIYENRILPLYEYEEIDECQMKSLIEENKGKCIACYLMSDEFKKLMKAI